MCVCMYVQKNTYICLPYVGYITSVPCKCLQYPLPSIAVLQLCKINNKFDNKVAITVKNRVENKQKLKDNFISNENTSDLSK